MIGLSATLLALIASAMCYLASPRQRWLGAPLHAGRALTTAALALLAAAVLWCMQAGTVAGLCATVCALLAGLALMPFAGTYWRHDKRSGGISGHRGAAQSNRSRPEAS